MKLKIAEISCNFSEDISDWQENQYVKLVDLYKLYKISHDKNLKIEICQELLEEINEILSEFQSNKQIKKSILEMKTDMEQYLKIMDI